MSKIAIDIVLLPPQEIMDICITANKKLNDEIQLNAESCLPHISLLMGAMKEADLEKNNLHYQQNYRKFFSY